MRKGLFQGVVIVGLLVGLGLVGWIAFFKQPQPPPKPPEDTLMYREIPGSRGSDVWDRPRR